MSALPRAKSIVWVLVVSTALAAPSTALGDGVSAAEAAPTAKGFQLGNLIKPFTPPTLEEMEKSAEWIDKPVLDGSEVLRKKQEESGPTPVTVQEALELRND